MNPTPKTPGLSRLEKAARKIVPIGSAHHAATVDRQVNGIVSLVQREVRRALSKAAKALCSISCLKGVPCSVRCHQNTEAILANFLLVD